MLAIFLGSFLAAVVVAVFRSNGIGPGFVLSIVIWFASYGIALIVVDILKKRNPKMAERMKVRNIRAESLKKPALIVIATILLAFLSFGGYLLYYHARYQVITQQSYPFLYDKWTGDRTYIPVKKAHPAAP